MLRTRQVAADVRRSLSEACQLSARARSVALTEVELLALSRRHGEATAAAKIGFAFQGVLRKDAQAWLHRSDLTVRSAAAARDAEAEALLRRLRALVDLANVATLRPAAAHEYWALFCAESERIADDLTD